MSTDEASQQREASVGAPPPGAGRALVPVREAPPVPVSPPVAAHRSGRRFALAGLLLLLIAAGAGGGWVWWEQHRQNLLPPGIASGNGRIEAEQVDVATKAAGRIEAVLVDEGAMVRAGQVLARMDTKELDAALRQAEAQGRQAQRALEARQAAAAQQRSQLDLAQKELDRTRSLTQTGYATRQALDQRTSARDTAAAALAAATAQIGEATQAVQAAAEATERIRTQIADSILTAPIDGRVQYRLAQPGEVLGAGGRVLTLLDISNVYMAIFLPTAEAGRLPLGTEARIVLDALPEFVIPASISFISPEAQFTPKAVETRSERERLMFRVKLRIDPDLLRRYAEQVRTGLPGLGYVRLDPAVSWPAWLTPGRRPAP